MDTAKAYLLVVEDDPDISQLLSTTLRYNGFRVTTARNGYEGLEEIQKERPAIVIADIMMPRMDGFGLVNRLRINPDTRDIPVVVITATYIAPEDREFAQNIGATSFIQKPLDLEKLLRTIQELLEQGAHIAIEPPKEFDFYTGYRKRLQVKLDQRIAQIARQELLLNGVLSDEERHAVETSLRQAMNDRGEIQLLLKDIDQKLQKD